MTGLVERLRELEIIHKEPVVLASGRTSNFYVDVKRACGDPKALQLMVEGMKRLIDEPLICIAGKGYGGITLASALAFDLGKKLTLVRDVEKKHGLGGMIDGYVPTANDKIAIVDDVFTSGKSLREVAKILEPTRAEIVGCYVVVKRGDAEGFELPLACLVYVEELI